MTRPTALILLSLALIAPLAGCAAGPAADTPQAACKRAALRDPTVHELLVRSVPGSEFAVNNAQRLADAKDKAYNDCLVAKGLAAPRGVERVRYPY